MGDTFSLDKPFKPNLSVKLLTGDDLKLYLLMRFGTYLSAATRASISDVRLHQIAAGYAVPENPDIIKKLADAWEIDRVLLTQLFEKLRRGDNGH